MDGAPLHGMYVYELQQVIEVECSQLCWGCNKCWKRWFLTHVDGTWECVPGITRCVVCWAYVTTLHVHVCIHIQCQPSLICPRTSYTWAQQRVRAFRSVPNWVAVDPLITHTWVDDLSMPWGEGTNVACGQSDHSCVWFCCKENRRRMSGLPKHMLPCEG